MHLKLVHLMLEQNEEWNPVEKWPMKNLDKNAINSKRICPLLT